MGVIKRGILGGFSGKVANVIGGSWKGIAYMRAMPLSVANPQTAGQVAQRNKMSSLVFFARLFLGNVIKPVMDRFAVQMSGFNDFVKVNMPVVDGNGNIDYTSIQFGSGILDNAIFAVNPSLAADNEITWADNSGTGSALATDLLWYAMFNESTGFASGAKSGTTRNTTTFTPIAPSDINIGDTVHVYIGFIAENGSKMSYTNHYAIIVTA